MAGKPWIVHYDAGVPSTLAPYPPRTLLEYVADTARQRFDHPALIFKNRRLTYGALERQSQAFAATLREWGVKKGDRVALVLPNCPQFVIAELAAWKAGTIAEWCASHLVSHCSHQGQTGPPRSSCGMRRGPLSCVIVVNLIWLPPSKQARQPLGRRKVCCLSRAHRCS